MNTYFKLIMLTLCLGFLSNANAQKKKPNMDDYPKYTLAVQPFHMFNGGLRLDFEKQLDSPKNWLQLSVSGYYLSHKNNSWDYWETPNSNFDKFSGLKGGGINAAYKSIFYGTSVYYSAGLGYTHYRVSYPGFEFIKYQEDGLTFYEGRETSANQNFNKISSNLCIGFQSRLNSTFFFDIYLGLAYSHSFYDKNKLAFDENPWGFGYSGLHFTGGLRFGITMGR